MGLELNTIFYVSAEEGLKKLGTESIDLVITSPPYDEMRSYDNGKEEKEKSTYEMLIDTIIEELWRVIKEHGVVVWVVGDQTKNYSESGTSFIQALKFKNRGFKLYDTMIFKKMNPPPQTHKRYEQTFEYIFIFSKNKPKTTNMIIEPCKYAGKNREGHTYRHTKSDKLEEQHTGGEVSEFKIRGNILEYMIGKNEAYKLLFNSNHPARFPILLVRDQVLSWSNANDIVLDPFSGSGTTAIVALLTGRNFIGFDNNKEYIEESKRNIEIVKNKLATKDSLVLSFLKEIDDIRYKEFEK